MYTTCFNIEGTATCRISAHSPQIALVFLAISLSSIKGFIFVMEMQFVFCTVKTEFIIKI
jgi:hypothetical protein